MVLSGRTMAALGCVVALAVMAGIIGAVVVFSGVGMFGSTPTVASGAESVKIVPTSGYVEQMKPLPGRIDVLGKSGYVMAAEEDGARTIARDETTAQSMVANGTGFFLANGTNVQILQIQGPLGRVQVMSGEHANRVGWLPINVTSTK